MIHACHQAAEGHADTEAANDADAWRRQMCLPLHCAPADNGTVKPALLDALSVACRMDGRVDLKQLGALSIRPCPWWLDLLTKVGAKHERGCWCMCTDGGAYNM